MSDSTVDQEIDRIVATTEAFQQMRAARDRYEAALREIAGHICDGEIFAMGKCGKCPVCVAREALAAAQEDTP
jgi:hypothetical protein